jgi:hypothetical protein
MRLNHRRLVLTLVIALVPYEIASAMRVLELGQ